MKKGRISIILCLDGASFSMDSSGEQGALPEVNTLFSFHLSTSVPTLLQRNNFLMSLVRLTWPVLLWCLQQYLLSSLIQYKKFLSDRSILRYFNHLLASLYPLQSIALYCSVFSMPLQETPPRNGALPEAPGRAWEDAALASLGSQILPTVSHPQQSHTSSHTPFCL